MTRLFTYKDAADTYGIPRDMLVEAVISGELKAIKRGRGFVRIREQDLDKYLENQARQQ